MAKLPRVTGKEMLDFLRRQGFSVVRVRGSHYVVNRGTVYTTVPVHAGRTLKIGTMRKILRDIDMEPDEFQRLLRQ